MFELDPESFVERLFEAVLGRPPDPATAAFWVQTIEQSGDPTRVLRALADSPEYRDRRRGRFANRPWEMTGGAASHRFDAISGLARSQPGLPPGLDVIVPVFNAAAWIDVLADAYAAHGIDPLYIVNAASSDASLDMLKARGARLFSAANPGPSVESFLRAIIPYLGGRWIVRFDDDELPSRETLLWIAENLERMDTTAVGLPLRSVRLDKGEAVACTAADGSWDGIRYYRLFRPAHVMPTQILHSAGFVFDSSYMAPARAAFLHFDWVVRSESERADKLRHYEAHTAGGGAYALQYLPERAAPGSYAYQKLDDPTAIEACRRLAERINATRA